MAKAKDKLDRITIDQLLAEFWKYYQPGSTHQTSKIPISIHQDRHRSKSMFTIFQIEDPIDLKHDPGKRVQNEAHKLQTYFETALVKY